MAAVWAELQFWRGVGVDIQQSSVNADTLKFQAGKCICSPSLARVTDINTGMSACMNSTTIDRFSTPCRHQVSTVCREPGMWRTASVWSPAAPAGPISAPRRTRPRTAPPRPPRTRTRPRGRAAPWLRRGQAPKRGPRAAGRRARPRPRFPGTATRRRRRPRTRPAPALRWPVHAAHRLRSHALRLRSCRSVPFCHRCQLILHGVPWLSSCGR